MRPDLKDFDSLIDYIVALYAYIDKLEDNAVDWAAKAAEQFGMSQCVLDDLKECINELCLHCGKYKNEHLGACKDCKWKELK